MDPYQPIDCALHSELELLAMRGTRVRFILGDNSGGKSATIGRVRDLFCRESAEYLLLVDDQEVEREVRLDRIVFFEPA